MLWLGVSRLRRAGSRINLRTSSANERGAVLIQVTILAPLLVLGASFMLSDTFKQLTDAEQITDQQAIAALTSTPLKVLTLQPDGSAAMQDPGIINAEVGRLHDSLQGNGYSSVDNCVALYQPVNAGDQGFITDKCTGGSFMPPVKCEQHLTTLGPSAFGVPYICVYNFDTDSAEIRRVRLALAPGTELTPPDPDSGGSDPGPDPDGSDPGPGPDPDSGPPAGGDDGGDMVLF